MCVDVADSVGRFDVLRGLVVLDIVLFEISALEEAAADVAAGEEEMRRLLQGYDTRRKMLALYIYIYICIQTYIYI